MDQTTKQIIRKIAQRQPRDRILRDLSERYRLEWHDAEQLVNEIEERYKKDISSRHRPALILRGIILALAGLMLTVYSLYLLLPGNEVSVFDHPFPLWGMGGLLLLGQMAFWAGARECIRTIKK